MEKKKKIINKTKTIIGTLDKIDFVDFDLEDVPCKIDTGAKTSAIHCHKVKIIERDGEEALSFQLLKHRSYKLLSNVFTTKDFKEVEVRSSSGQAEFRYMIKTKIQLFGKVYSTEFTLAHRERMQCPVLLGTKLLKNRFLVDVSLKNLSHNLKIQNTHGTKT